MCYNSVVQKRKEKMEKTITGVCLTDQADTPMKIINMEDRYQLFFGENLIGTFNNFCAAVSFAKNMHPVSMNEFPQYLRGMRDMHHMSQREMAQYLGVSISCLQKWEQRQRTPKKLTQKAVEQKIRRII